MNMPLHCRWLCVVCIIIQLATVAVADTKVDAENRYGVTPLSIACLNGDASAARALIDAGADPNLAITGDETPLMTAARTGNVDVVRVLIDAGADVNATEVSDQTALMWAAAEGNTDVVDMLIDAGAVIDAATEQDFTAMLFAARQGHIETTLRLVDAGADVDRVMKPKNTSGRNPRARMSALMLAVESGHFELALALVERGADPDDQRSGYTPLHAITWVRKTDRGDNVEGDPPPRGSGTVNSLDFVRRIVATGADVNAKLERGSGGRAKLNHRGATPFLLASKTADLALMETLLELGADPMATNVDGCNALMAAAGVGVTAVGEEAGTEPEVLAVVDRLIALGLNPDAVDQNGETAMHGAAYRNYPAVVERLASHGAIPGVWNRPNKYGWTPTMIASGKRPGSFKPSPPTIEALQRAMDR
jgi:uncharacterized protein